MQPPIVTSLVDGQDAQNNNLSKTWKFDSSHKKVSIKFSTKSNFANKSSGIDRTSAKQNVFNTVSTFTQVEDNSFEIEDDDIVNIIMEHNPSDNIIF